MINPFAPLTKSEIFTAYNKARAALRKAGEWKAIERLNKALGILQSKAYYQGERAAYLPTDYGCGCKDWEFRSVKRRQYAGPCKHMMAEALVNNILYARKQHDITSWVSPKVEAKI